MDQKKRNHGGKRSNSGKKSKSGSGSTETSSFRLKPEIRVKLAKLAKDQKTTQTSVLESLIEKA